MREIKKDIEQLEEASHQLSKRSPTGARLALLLLDNLAELFMYKKVRLIFAHDNQFEPSLPPKYPIGKREKILEHFNEKVNFLVSETQDIEQDEGEFIKIGHQIRNEAYHNGVLREAIILNVTMIYFEIVCRLLSRLWVGSFSYSHPEEVTTFLQRYGIQSFLIDIQVLTEICNRLLEGKTCPVNEFCETLSEDLLRRIDETVEGLEYLSSNTNPPSTPDDCLKRLQFIPMFRSKYKFANTDEGFRKFIKTWDELLSKYKPPVTMGRVERWKQRASELKSEIKPGSAMRKFAGLDRELLPLERMVGDAIFQFDEEVDAEIHHRKGG
jgi:hypothetical protein